MTTKELKTYLSINSPFKIKGSSTDTYTFTEITMQINSNNPFAYTLIQNGEYFNLEDPGGIIPFFINTKLFIPASEDFPIIINYDEQRLKDDLYRDKDAESGFFILQPLVQTKNT